MHCDIVCIEISDEKCGDTISRLRMNATDFEVVKTIGRGAFGEVQLVRYVSPLVRFLFQSFVIIFVSSDSDNYWFVNTDCFFRFDIRPQEKCML